MNNHYDPNQPRNAEGEWTDAGGAIKKAASDKKKRPLEELKETKEELEELQTKLHVLADQIRFGKNQGGVSGDVIELVDQWGAIKDKVERLRSLHDSIYYLEIGVKEGNSNDFLQARLDRKLLEVDKEIKNAKRAYKKALGVYNSIK